jgi:hypothetical protein
MSNGDSYEGEYADDIIEGKGRWVSSTLFLNNGFHYSTPMSLEP